MTKPLSSPVSRRTILKGAALGGVATFIAACAGTKASPAPCGARRGALGGPQGGHRAADVRQLAGVHRPRR